MKNFSKYLLNIIIILYLPTLLHAEDTKVYSWRSENGNVVFSETKPNNDVDYKTIEVGQPTVVDTKNPVSSENKKHVEINQQDMDKLADSKLANENNQALEEIGQAKEFSIQKVGANAAADSVFTKEDKLAVITSPTLKATDKPVFILNEKQTPAIYSGKYWEIPRPTPGENKISISGKTEDGNKITSNTFTFYVKNATVLQMKNTGNYRPRPVPVK